MQREGGACCARMVINIADLVRIGQGREADVFALDAERVIKVAPVRAVCRSIAKRPRFERRTAPECRYRLRTS
jgi:hypothetical protein